MSKCNFCGKVIERGSGKMYVEKDGKILYFCKNKCEKNTFKLGRKARETKWTREFHKNKKAAKVAKADKK